jgi:hypothetical protein
VAAAPAVFATNNTAASRASLPTKKQPASTSSAAAHLQYSAEVAAKAEADRAAAEAAPAAELYLGEPLTAADHAELLATNAAVRAQGDRPALLGGIVHHLPETLRLDPLTSKKAQAIAWLQRPNGVLRSSLMSALGWQKHTIAGFMAGAVRKAGFAVASYKCGEDRMYRIVGGGARSTEAQGRNRCRALRH